MKKIIALTLACLFALTIGLRSSYAAEIDTLLQKLVEKGILNSSEAQEIRTETNQEIVKRDKQKEEDYKKIAKDNMPDWVKNLKLKGDLRLRYQFKNDKVAGDVARQTQIGRVRLRLGLEGKVNDKLTAGVGIASGSGDPRSTNITFGSYNTKKTIVLDYAYAKYKPLEWLSFVGGKMNLSDTLWEPTDLIWDTDITPEGGILQFTHGLGDNAKFFFNTGALIIDADTSTDADGPMAYVIQPGVTYKVNEDVSLKGAFAWQDITNTAGHVSSTYSGASNTGNTTAGTSSYTYNYNMINPAVELSIKEPLQAMGMDVKVGTLKLIGEYVNNVAVSNAASGFAGGFKLGSDIKKWGDWSARYLYTMLGRDATLDVLPDSDRYSGKTGIRSHELELQFGLGKNTFFGVDVYRSWRTYGAKAPETLVQADWNMKF